MTQLFRTKSIESIQAQAAEGEKSLKKTLGRLNLINLGIGGIIGAGIFSITGTAAAVHAGPAIVIAFLVSAVACALAGLCYAEMSAMLPLAGSAYTYAYATMGELVAWIIGWDLILEYLFSASTVAVGWSGYFISFLKDMGINFPIEYASAWGQKLINIPEQGWKVFDKSLIEKLSAKQIDYSSFEQTTGILNLPAIGLILFLSLILIKGIKESTVFNNFMVVFKVVVILMFIVIGFRYINWDNLTPFIPETKTIIADNGTPTKEFGWIGIFRAAGIIFFAYIGFDAVSTAAQEAKNPQKDMAAGILVSLAICTVLYVLFSFVMTGVVHYSELNNSAPAAYVVDKMGAVLAWFRLFIKVAAIAGLSSATLTMLYSQPRIFLSMSKDGLLPKIFGKVHPSFGTPVFGTILTCTVAALIAGIFPIDVLGELVSIGTLLAFIIVCGGVLYLRYSNPNAHRPFKVPAIWFVSIAGILTCFAQMIFLDLTTWARLFIWLSVGMLIYYFYGMKNSKLKNEPK
jgi:basic amino acid/polyamine antiporter, APA family